MENKDTYIEVYASLLKKYFDGALSQEERKQLAAWLRADRKNRILLRQLRSARNLKTYFTHYQSIDPEREYALLQSRYKAEDGRKIRRFYGRQIAAAVVLLLSGLISWYLLSTDKPVLTENHLAEEKSGVILKTFNGGIFHLKEGIGNQTGLQQAGILVNDSLQELICQDVSDTLHYHELKVPRGGEYKLILSDGTRVWLNSESGIRFPGAFGHQNREIEIYGEVYLEVKRDEARSFRVKAGEGKIEVLGTSFGMNVYPQEQVWTTTLVEGSVKVYFGKSNLILSPGKKAFVTDGRLEEITVDTEKELAWLRGIFVFEHDHLGDVVKKLERWYSVTFRFENEKIKEYVFTGQVSRDTGVEQILDLMERMNVVSFEQREGYILIKEKAGEF